MSRVSRMLLPLSIDSSTASSRELRCTARASAYRYRARPCPPRAVQAGSALRAAFTAASTSRFEPSDTSAITLPVAGFITSKVRDAFVHAPPM